MHRPPRSQLARPLTVAAALAALTPAAGPAAAASPAAASPGSVPHGLDLAGIDRAAAPGDDFFRYANGNWLKATEIPPDRSSYGTSAMLAELTTQRTVDLIRAAADGAAAGSEAAKIGDY
ncbi:MAG: M13 family peptidase, partial [Gammaproteobacteria bacterium]